MDERETPPSAASRPAESLPLTPPPLALPVGPAVELVAPTRSFTYEVIAVDAAGNQVPPPCRLLFCLKNTQKRGTIDLAQVLVHADLSEDEPAQELNANLRFSYSSGRLQVSQVVATQTPLFADKNEQ